jgi:hypothetical protein
MRNVVKFGGHGKFVTRLRIMRLIKIRRYRRVSKQTGNSPLYGENHG